MWHMVPILSPNDFSLKGFWNIYLYTEGRPFGYLILKYNKTKQLSK